MLECEIIQGLLKVQFVGFMGIYWQKLNMILIIMFSTVYHYLTLRIVFWSP